MYGTNTAKESSLNKGKDWISDQGKETTTIWQDYMFIMYNSLVCNDNLKLILMRLVLVKPVN